MKSFVKLLAALLALGGPAAPAWAQKTVALKEQSAIAAYRLGVGIHKTSHLVFPFAVTSIDLGSGDIIAAKAEGANNIVKVKAAKPGFEETNMTVLTSDGKLYSFIVNYEGNPKILTVDLGANAAAESDAGALPGSPKVQLSSTAITQSNLDSYSKAIVAQNHGGGSSETRNEMQLAVKGIYTRDDAFFFNVYVQNKSNIGYDIDFIKFYIQDKTKVKRTAEQEKQLTPFFVYNEGQKAVSGQTKLNKVFVFKKFTFPDDKNLIVEMFEKGGGRQLTLTLSNKDILHATVLQ